MLVMAANEVSPVTAALIAAGGGVVGGALTAGSSLLLEWRRGKRQQRAAQEDARKEVRMAARLVKEEIDNAEELVSDTEKSGKYWTRPERQLAAAAWNEHRTILAVHLDEIAWVIVAAAFAEINHLNWVVVEREKALAWQQRNVDDVMDVEILSVPVDPDDGIDDALEVIRNARDALEEEAGTP